MNAFLNKNEEKILKSFLIILVIAYSFHSLTAYTSDSEFWSIALAKLLYTFDGHIGLLQKMPFYFLLNIPYLLFHDSVLVLIFEKILFYLISLGIFYFCYKILKLYQIEKKSIFAFFIVLLLFELVFGQTFRIRADNLSLLFFLMLFYFGLKDPNDTPLQTLKLFSLCLLTFLSTPKAIYFILCFSLFHVYHQLNWFKKVKSVLIFLLLPLFIPLFSAFILNLFGSSYLMDAYTNAILYYLNSFSHLSFQSNYLSIDSFYSLIRSITRSPIHFIFIFYALFLGMKFRKQLAKNVYILLPICFMGLLFVVFHNQKLTFFINSMLLPVFLFSVVIFLKTSCFLSLNLERHYIAKASVLVLFLVNSIMQVSQLTIRQNGLKQISIISSLQTYFNQFPESDIYDGIGILNSGKILYSFPGPGDKVLKAQALDMLKDYRPDFIIYTPKLAELEPQISLILDYQYIPIAKGIWAYANLNEGHTMSTSFPKMDINLPNDISYYFSFEWSDFL